MQAEIICFIKGELQVKKRNRSDISKLDRDECCFRRRCWLNKIVNRLDFENASQDVKYISNSFGGPGIGPPSEQYFHRIL